MKSDSAKRAALVLGTVRKLFVDRMLDGPSLQAVGVEFDGILRIEDPRLSEIVLEAGRSAGFGTEGIDREISNYLDARHGFNRWRQQRPPHLWERGGGDPRLEVLLDEEDAAIRDRERLESEMWKCWDEKQRIYSIVDERNTGSLEILKGVVTDLDKAQKAWEKSRERESLARGAVANRQSALQENFLQRQIAARAGH